jgi:hypothetical protein
MTIYMTFQVSAGLKLGILIQISQKYYITISLTENKDIAGLSVFVLPASKRNEMVYCPGMVPVQFF